jgi:heme-degrading monooxygenase HmoA
MILHPAALALDEEEIMTDDTTRKARFARIWRGRTTRGTADTYEHYWLENGIDLLLAKGALEVQMLRDDRETETEFMAISTWESIEAMTGGKGGDPYLTHHLDRDRELLIELPERVQILRILEPRGLL